MPKSKWFDMRKSGTSGRRINREERRRTDRQAGKSRIGALGITHLEGRDFTDASRIPDGPSAQYGIVETKVQDVRPERRLLGAGRRKGDFANAMAKGKPVVLDVSKSPKSAFTGKGIGKLSKKAGAFGLGLAALGFAKEAKAWFKGAE